MLRDFLDRKCKKGSISKPNRPADGTRFSEVVFLTWSQCFFTISKVKNSVPEHWRIKAQIGLRGAKSPKKGSMAGRRGRPPWPPPWPPPSRSQRPPPSRSQRPSPSLPTITVTLTTAITVTLTTATAVTLDPSITVSLAACINETWLRRHGMSGCAC